MSSAVRLGLNMGIGWNIPFYRHYLGIRKNGSDSVVDMKYVISMWVWHTLKIWNTLLVFTMLQYLCCLNVDLECHVVEKFGRLKETHHDSQNEY